MRYLIVFLLLMPFPLAAQPWVSTDYSIASSHDIYYGSATGFAGAEDSLLLDISFPTDDQPPVCGRPLLIVIHGGSWMAGDKDEGYATRFREDFAKRGYVVASINYRLGLFHTDRFVNCNVADWNCFNSTDSTEWYRANFRGIQDVKGAIRYLVGQKAQYEIDPDNVFILGESAGAFIALGVGFLEDNEIPNGIVSMMPDAPAPNTLYENNCIKKFNLANSINEMDLSRPNMGSVEGSLHTSYIDSFTIKGVASYYGGVFHNIFRSAKPQPALYLYHQACDLIVPHRTGRLLAGYNTCYSGFPANCGTIINRPVVWGSYTIADTLAAMLQNGENTPELEFEGINFNYNCLQQATNPAIACHAIDNYALRTRNLASFFSRFVSSCTVGSTLIDNSELLKVYPNPSSGKVYVESRELISNLEVSLFNSVGNLIAVYKFSGFSATQLDLDSIERGFYYFKIRASNNPALNRVVPIVIK
ncbi:MAG: carboxylesterase family protein [Saprospiraceae bacterium]|nr:carboxylesterase family protein [Saprospiraceae bacterium]